MRTRTALSSLVLAAATLLLATRIGARGFRNATPAPSRQVTVAAAADLKFALDDLVAAFRLGHPEISVTVSYGSSGNFFAQLSEHAPFDLFFSADAEYQRRLARQGNTLEGSLFLYAVGRLVVWVPRSSPLDVEKLGISALVQTSVRRIAIANPTHAPYGRAAAAALRSLGVSEALRDKLVLGENVAQAAQFVQSGSADAGIIALSLAIAPAMKGEGRFWVVPLDSYPGIEQGGVVLKWARDPTSALALREFVLTPEGRDILRRYGFFLPGN
jgi:molybdate transport system substrate-binding protein